MVVSDSGVGFICSFEGFIPHPYHDPGSVDGRPYTIGFGTTVYPSGVKVTMEDTQVTKEQALSFVKHHIDTGISPYLTEHCPAVTQPQFDSLCSLVYNIGLGNFKTSTVLRDVIAQVGCDEITKAFLMWQKAGGKVLPGLTRRRQAESHLYCSGTYGSI